MKLKPINLILVVVALILGGVAYVTQRQTPTDSSSQTEAQPVFAFEEKQVQALTLTTSAQTVQFERDENGVWQMIEPEQAIANDASVAYLVNLLATAMSDRTLSVPASDQASFGLDQPLATIKATLDNNETHTLVIGRENFNQTARYAIADPPAEAASELKVVLVSPDFENAVGRSLEEWKAAEAEGTPSPTPEATPTPDASPTPSASPGASATPTPTNSPDRASPSPTPSPDTTTNE